MISCGGLGIHEFLAGNQADVLKQLWSLEFIKKKEIMSSIGPYLLY